MKPFPREVWIQMTVEQARKEIDLEDYNGGSSQLEEVMGTIIGESMQEIIIDSWKDIPKGYELSNEDDIEDHEEYLGSRKKI